MYLYILLSLFISHISTEKLKKVAVTNRISMEMPTTFRLMTDDEIVAKYFTTTKPVALYTDPTLMIDLGVNKSITKWKESDLEIMVSFQKSNIYSIYDEINIIDESIQEINGRKAAVIAFESKINSAADAMVKKSPIAKYTYIQYMIVGKITLVFNFTCPLQLKTDWEQIAKAMMQSIVIKKLKK